MDQIYNLQKEILYKIESLKSDICAKIVEGIVLTCVMSETKQLIYEPVYGITKSYTFAYIYTGAYIRASKSKQAHYDRCEKMIHVTHCARRESACNDIIAVRAFSAELA